ncbi:MAG: hypothetical protein CL844_07925 [Crocinitomicaceae bacterium]|nr:hypothetical protein [Crocinitomicaceae bacterium]
MQMLKKTIMKTLLVLLLLVPMMSFGQPTIEWETTFGGSDSTYSDAGYSVKQTWDGGYIVAGSTDRQLLGYYNSDGFLIKTDGSGQEEWSQTYGGDNDDVIRDVQQTSDGGYILVGSTGSQGLYYQVYLIKTDGYGQEEWSQTFGGGGEDLAYSVQQTSDGGYIIVGQYEHWGINDYDVWLIKTNGAGQEEWNQKIGGPNKDVGFFVQQTTDGSYIVLGETRSFGNGNTDIYLIKVNSNGNIMWTQFFGTGGEESGYSLEETLDGGYIICGESSGTQQVQSAYMIKTDESGIEEWSILFEQTYMSSLSSVKQTANGGFIAAGFLNTNNNWSDIYLVETDENGIEQWSQTFGGLEPERAYSVQQTIDGGYIVTGKTKSFGSNEYDIYLLKTMSLVTSTNSIITSSSNKKLIKIVDLLGRETPFKPNIPLLYIYNDGTVERKMIIKE